MLKLLLKKDFKEIFLKPFKKQKQKPLTIIFNLILAFILMFFLLYLFIMLEKRFRYYGVNQEVFVIALSLILVIQLFFHLPKFSKMVFNSLDKDIINPLPISKRSIFLSKFLIFYLEELISLACLTLPLSLTYLILNHLSFPFYLLLIPILIILPLVSLGFSLLLSYPCFQISELIKNKYLIQFILILLLITGVSLFYDNFLNMFISLVKEDRLAYLFNTDNALLLRKISKFLVPSSFIVGIMNGHYLNILYLVLTFVFFSFLSYFLSSFLYNLKIHTFKKKHKKKKNKVSSSTFALIKKEYLLTFRNSNFLVSYGSLLVLLPIFLLIIVSSLKPLIIRLIGNNFFLPFAILFVTMFSSIINSFGGLFISKEKKSIMILKMLPVSYKKQMDLKLGIHLFNAGLSLFISMLILAFNKTLSFLDSGLIFIIAYALIIILAFMMAKKDLKNPSYELENNNLTTAIIFSLIIPVILFIISLAFLIFMPKIRMFLLIILGLFLVCFLSYSNYKRSINKNFRKLRV